MEIVEAAVIDALVQKAKDIAELGARAPKKKSTKLIELEQELIEIETLEARFKSKRYAQAKQDVLNQIREAKIQEDSGEAVSDFKKSLLSSATIDRTFWELLTSYQKRTLFHELVEAVTIIEGKVTAVELKI
jgi:hypothetical protein